MFVSSLIIFIKKFYRLIKYFNVVFIFNLQMYPQYKVKPEQSYGPFPFNCSSFPYNADTMQVRDAGEPGVDADITCTVNPYYCESLDNIETLMDLYFGLWVRRMSIANIDFAKSTWNIPE